MQSSLLAFCRTILIFLCIGFFMPLFIVLHLSNSARKQQFYSIFSSVILFIANVKITVHGRISHAAPVLYASNHTSYLDIMIFGKLIAKPFIAKQEVKGWPIVGDVAKLIGTVFIDRLMHKTPDNIKTVREVMHKEGGLILFAEGTTNNGNRVLPFKSSFFSLAEQEFSGNILNIQPVAITYTRINNIPMGTLYRPYVAWYGDMTLLPHAWQMLKFWSIGAEVVFFPAVSSSQFASRKEITRYCYGKVAMAVESMLTGRKEKLIAELGG